MQNAVPAQVGVGRAATEATPARPSWRRLLRACAPLLRSRLAQFAVLGGALFAVGPRARSPRDVTIVRSRLDALHAAEASRTGSPALSAPQAREVDQRALEDELLYREGVRLGLDQNDGIVRQRVVQKVLFLAEEVAGASRAPSEAEILAFFDENRARWAVPESVRFDQIYQHGRDALAAWAEGPRTTDPPVGEASPVAAQLEGDRARFDASLGPGFAEALAAARPGEWCGPFASAFGFHLVRVLERRPARPARLDEVRGSVVELCTVHRRQEAVAAFLEGAFRRYSVAIDGEPLRQFSPSRRVAFRTVASGED